RHAPGIRIGHWVPSPWAMGTARPRSSLRDWGEAPAHRARRSPSPPAEPPRASDCRGRQNASRSPAPHLIDEFLKALGSSLMGVEPALGAGVGALLARAIGLHQWLEHAPALG